MGWECMIEAAEEDVHIYKYILCSGAYVLGNPSPSFPPSSALHASDVLQSGPSKCEVRSDCPRNPSNPGKVFLAPVCP